MTHSVVMEDQYGEHPVPVRKLPLLYRMFKRFELHRVDKVSKFIQGKRLRVLEIGAGDGKFLLKNAKKWSTITGVDVVEKQIRRAKKNNYGVKATFLQKDFGVEPMPFASSSFDVIVSISTIQYVLDLDLFFSECFRTLKRNGTIVIEVPNSAVFWRRVFFLFGHFPQVTEYTDKWSGGVLHYFTHQNLVSFLKGKGFEIKAVSCSGVFHQLREFWPSLLGADLIVVAKKL